MAKRTFDRGPACGADVFATEFDAGRCAELAAQDAFRTEVVDMQELFAHELVPGRRDSDRQRRTLRGPDITRAIAPSTGRARTVAPATSASVAREAPLLEVAKVCSNASSGCPPILGDEGPKSSSAREGSEAPCSPALESRGPVVDAAPASAVGRASGFVPAPSPPRVVSLERSERSRRIVAFPTELDSSKLGAGPGNAPLLGEPEGGSRATESPPSGARGRRRVTVLIALMVGALAVVIGLEARRGERGKTPVMRVEKAPAPDHSRLAGPVAAGAPSAEPALASPVASTPAPVKVDRSRTPAPSAPSSGATLGRGKAAPKPSKETRPLAPAAEPPRDAASAALGSAVQHYSSGRLAEAARAYRAAARARPDDRALVVAAEILERKLELSCRLGGGDGAAKHCANPSVRGAR